MPGDPFDLTPGARASLERKPTARLASIAMRNFGPYRRRTELEIRPLTILCGPNGAGKSTWLRAVEWLRESCQSSPTWLASLDEPSSGRLFTRDREDDLPPSSALLSLTMDFETWPSEDMWLRGMTLGPQRVAQRMHRSDGTTPQTSMFSSFLEQHGWAGQCNMGTASAGRVRVDLHFRPKDRHRRGMKSLAKVSATFLDRRNGVEMQKFSIATPQGISVNKGPGSDFLPEIQVLLDDVLQHSFTVSAVRTSEAGTRAVTDFDGGPPRVHRDGRGTQAILAHLRYALMVPWRAAECAATQPDGGSKHASDLIEFLSASASNADEMRPSDSSRQSRISRRQRGAKIREMQPLDLLRQVARESGFRGLPRGWRAAAQKGWTGAFNAILREGGPAWEDKYLGNIQPLLEFWRADPGLRSIGNFVALAVMLSHADRSSTPDERAAILPDALRDEIPEFLVKAMEYVTTLQDVASSWMSRITGVRMDDASPSSVDQPGLPVIQPVSAPPDLVLEPCYVSHDPAILPTLDNGMVCGRPSMFSEGFHQASPIIVQLLTAKPFATICIENPEVHLHPAAQITMAELLLDAALGGRHVIVETHSDLIVRRILRAGAETPATLESIGIYGVSLRRAGKRLTAALECIRRDESGRVMNWPDGFLSDDAEESGRMLAAIARKPATDA